MTAICIVRTSDAIAIASDGAFYDDDGVVRQIASKVTTIPSASFAITSRGASVAHHAFCSAIFWSSEPIVTFDDVVRYAAPLARHALAETVQRSIPSTWQFTLFLCGWSIERDRMETYRISSREWDGVPAFTLVPLPAVYYAPDPPGFIMADVGIEPASELTAMPSDAAQYACRTIMSCRLCDDGSGHAKVGAFIELTVVRRDALQAQIVHRWPDRIGERMDPARGTPHEIMPPWMLDPMPAAL